MKVDQQVNVNQDRRIMSDSDEREVLKAETEEEDEEGQERENDLEKKREGDSGQEDQVTQIYIKSQPITLNNLSSKINKILF